MIRRKPLALLLLYQGMFAVVVLTHGATAPADDPPPSPPPVHTGWTVFVDPGYTPGPAAPCLPVEDLLQIDGCPAVLR